MTASGQAKVADFDMRYSISTADEYVFRLEIPMDYVVKSMNMSQALQNLSKKSPDLLSILI
jgi:hypothetical protein